MVDSKELRPFTIFQELGDSELDALAPLATEETYGPGERIIKEGAPAVYLYLVKSGKLLVKMTAASEREVLLDEAGPRMSVGWSTLSGRKTSSASVDAAEPSVVIRFEGKQLRRLFEEDSRLGYGVMLGVNRIVSRRLDRCRSRFAAWQ